MRCTLHLQVKVEESRPRDSGSSGGNHPRKVCVHLKSKLAIRSWGRSEALTYLGSTSPIISLLPQEIADRKETPRKQQAFRPVSKSKPLLSLPGFILDNHSCGGNLWTVQTLFYFYVLILDGGERTETETPTGCSTRLCIHWLALCDQGRASPWRTRTTL